MTGLASNVYNWLILRPSYWLFYRPVAKNSFSLNALERAAVNEQCILLWLETVLAILGVLVTVISLGRFPNRLAIIPLIVAVIINRIFTTIHNISILKYGIGVLPRSVHGEKLIRGGAARRWAWRRIIGTIIFLPIMFIVVSVVIFGIGLLK